MLLKNRWAGVVLLLIAVTAVACSKDASGPGVLPRNFTINAVGGSGVTGTVTITDGAGAVSTVTVTLQGMAPGSAHAGHVHRGTCGSDGAIDFGLALITADAAGNGSATSPNVPDDVLGPGFYLQYHVAQNPPGAPMACANVPAAVDGGGDPGY